MTIAPELPGAEETIAHGDHRLALLGAVAGLASEHGVVVLGMEAADVSYPGFMDDIEALAS
jgi:3-phosphoshikimate 1-carboxyvinyltransferase